jgi:hypothetical protein
MSDVINDTEIKVQSFHTRVLEMSEPIFDKLCDNIYQTFPKACIIWIEEIINPELQALYESYKLTINPPNEKRLFHGTLDTVAHIIAKEGFDPTLNKTSAFGKGVYFSTQASYSSAYCKRTHGAEMAYMLVCDVITGKVGQGKANQPIPVTFNSVTNTLRHPSMYIVNKKEAALPRYLIVFYPDAEYAGK